jgi:CheY-like chemotaxis protein
VASKDYINHTSVLIVDDDKGINTLFEYYLKTSGYKGKIFKAYNGQEAIEICKQHDPTIIFMDIQMPVVDGISATKIIRGFGYDKPILIVSAWAELEQERCLDAGASAVIHKPVVKDELLLHFQNYTSKVKL